MRYILILLVASLPTFFHSFQNNLPGFTINALVNGIKCTFVIYSEDPQESKRVKTKILIKRFALQQT